MSPLMLLFPVHGVFGCYKNFANTVIHSSAYEIIMASPFVRVAHSDWS